MKGRTATIYMAIAAIIVLAIDAIQCTLDTQKTLNMAIPLPYLAAIAINSAIIGFMIHRSSTKNKSFEVTLTLASIYTILCFYQTTVESSVPAALPKTFRAIICLTAMGIGWITFLFKDPRASKMTEIPKS